MVECIGVRSVVFFLVTSNYTVFHLRYLLVQVFFLRCGVATTHSLGFGVAVSIRSQAVIVEMATTMDAISHSELPGFSAAFKIARHAPASDPKILTIANIFFLLHPGSVGATQSTS